MRAPFLLKIIGCCLAAFGLISFFANLVLTSPTIPWKEADEGLLVAEFESVFDKDPYALTVVKIDPARYSFQLLCATEYGKSLLPQKNGLQGIKCLRPLTPGCFRRTA